MTGVVSGAFDLLHFGHVDFLRRAKMACDKLVVAVNSDDSVKRTKGMFRPVFSQPERIAIVGALRCVDVVTGFDSEGDLDAVCRDFAPHLVRIVGDDYRGRTVTGAQWAKSVIYLPRGTYSTTSIIERIQRATV